MFIIFGDSIPWRATNDGKGLGNGHNLKRHRILAHAMRIIGRHFQD